MKYDRLVTLIYAFVDVKRTKHEGAVKALFGFCGPLLSSCIAVLQS